MSGDMRSLTVSFLLCMTIVASAEGDMDAILRIAGAVSLEDMDPDEVERLGDLLRAPVKVNVATVAELEASGIFSHFQIASIVDYRKRHGAVLSYTELSSVDGFSEGAVTDMRPFIDIDDVPDVGMSKRTSHDLYVRSSGRYDVRPEYAYGFKYRSGFNAFKLSLSANKDYRSDGNFPSSFSGNLTWNHSKGKVLVGDFNARFGQGICLWNASLNMGLDTPSAYMKKASGISPAFSFTGSSAMTGVAADYTSGSWRLSASVAVPGIKDGIPSPDGMKLMPAVNLSRYGSLGTVSVTHYMSVADFAEDISAFRIPDMRTSCDASLCLKGFNVFGEIVYDWIFNKISTLCGTDYSVGESLRMAALLKYSPADAFSNEYLAAFCGEYVSRKRRLNSGRFSAEALYHPESKSKDGARCVQVKLKTDWKFMITDRFGLSFRFSERLRTWGQKFRTDVRFDASYLFGNLELKMRLNALKCAGLGLLGYVEGIYKSRGLSSCLRSGVLSIDDWDDRIYVYEHDAPGSFNVPAYYGRGVWVSWYMSWKYASWGQMCIRASWIDYMLMTAEKRKPGRAELKIQTLFRF